MDNPTRRLGDGPDRPSDELNTQRFPDRQAGLPACSKCGGEVIWVRAKSHDANSLGAGYLFLEHPEYSFWRPGGRTDCEAQTCLQCGYTELYAMNPEALRLR